MRLRLLFAALAAVLLLALGVACGGGDDGGTNPSGSGQAANGDGHGSSATEGPTPTIPPNLGRQLTLQEYFTTIDGIFESADTATNNAQAELDSALASQQQLNDQIATIQGYLDTELSVFSDAIGRLNALNPPDELDADHAAFIQAVNDAANAASNLQFALDGVDSEDAANQLINDFQTSVTEITARSDKACSNLQTVADANNIAVDLNCEN